LNYTSKPALPRNSNVCKTAHRKISKSYKPRSQQRRTRPRRRARLQAIHFELEQRKKLTAVDEGVEKAKSEVVKCLRENDRRPLDCWKEVENFKNEVRRLEGVWVEKIVR